MPGERLSVRVVAHLRSIRIPRLSAVMPMTNLDRDGAAKRWIWSGGPVQTRAFDLDGRLLEGFLVPGTGIEPVRTV